MKKYILFLVLSIPLIVNAQFRVTGNIKDSDGYPIDAATVILKQNNKEITSALADQGNFTLNYSTSGTYTVYASFIGYEESEITVQLPQDSIVLVMVPKDEQLQEILITVRRPLIERKIDRVVFNVENSIIASGGSAWDALTKAPGVQSGSDNNLTANRKNVQVYLDGKALKLSGDDLSSYLQGLPSDLIAKVEVYTNPPAKFEADGTSVINILTKKADKPGLNLSLNSGLIQGIYSSYNSNGNFNYRKDNLNIYGSYGFAHRHNFQDHDNYINYGDSFWNAPNHIINRSKNHNYRLGADYQLADNQILGLLITGNNRTGSSYAHSLTQVTGEQMVLDSTLITDNSNRNSGAQYAFNLNYNIKFNSGKKSINLDFDYLPYQSNNDSWVDNISLLPNGSQTFDQFHIYTPSSQKIDIYSGKAEMSYQLFGKWESTSGLKYSNTKSFSNFDYFNRNESSLENVSANSNYFVYKEKTVAAYKSTSGTFGKWTMNAGLRGEYTMIDGYSITLKTLNTKSYFKLFPTLFLQYESDEDNQLQFNYAYRIERPEYSRLNPSKLFNSPFNIYVGNPALQPSFTHNLELNYTYRQKYGITAYFTKTTDIFSNINIQDNANKIYYGTHANLDLSMSTGIRLSASIRVLNWWDMDFLADLYRQQDKSVYLSSNYNYHIYSHNATLKQSFTIDKKLALKAEISATSIGPSIQGIYRQKHNSEVDAGVKVNILKGNGTLRLTANDIFNTNYYLVRINYLDQQSTSLHRIESRNFSLSLSYRLGKSVTDSHKRITGSEEEKMRTQ